MTRASGRPGQRRARAALRRPRPGLLRAAPGRHRRARRPDPLEAAEKLTSATLDTTACIILVTDLQGRVVRVNAATTALTGYPEDELLGRQVWETAHRPADATTSAAAHGLERRPGRTVVRESDVVTRDGERLRIVWNTNMVRDEDGRPIVRRDDRHRRDRRAHHRRPGDPPARGGASPPRSSGSTPQGRITVFNSGAQHLLGYQRRRACVGGRSPAPRPDELLERTGADDARRGVRRWSPRTIGRDGETRARDWTWLARTASEQRSR